MGGYLIFFGTLLILTISSQQSEGRYAQQPQENVILLGNNRFEIADNFTIQGLSQKCTTEADIFRCCVGIESGMNITACVSIEYLEEEYGLELNVTINNFQLYHEKISARNPPPICFQVPYLEKIADACFRIHDLDIQNKTLTGCVDFEAHLEYFKVYKHRMGCFTIPVGFFGKKGMYDANLMINHIK